MLRIKLLILFVVIKSFTFCQEKLKIRVNDFESNDPIAFAEIIIYNKEKNIIEKTDLNGELYHFLTSNKDFNLIVKNTLESYLTIDTLIQLKNIKNQTVEIKLKKALYKDSVFIGSKITKKQAIEDLNKGIIQLYLPGGLISPTLKESDFEFEKKYNLKFKWQTCCRFPDDNPKEYNEIVFDYLDTKFGNMWREEVTKKVIGIN